MLYYFLSVICWEWWGLTALTQIISQAQNFFSKTLRKKYPYSEFFWSLFYPYFIASVNQSKCRKIWTRKTPIKDTFCSMKNIQKDKNVPSIDFLNSGYHFSVRKFCSDRYQPFSNSSKLFKLEVSVFRWTVHCIR